MVTVQVIGLGTVGKPTAEHFSHYHDVLGHDVKNGTSIVKADAYVICTPTHTVTEVAEQLKPFVTSDTLTIVESTVPVGTTREIHTTIGGYVATCPHRLWLKNVERYGVVQTRVLGAVNHASLQKAKALYDSVKIPVHTVSNAETAELSKLAENAYRYVEIAYAEELALTCEKHGLNFNELREACNTLKRYEHGWQVQIMEAQDGIGGTCLPRDTQILMEMCNPNWLLKGAVETDAHYRKTRSA